MKLDRRFLFLSAAIIVGAAGYVACDDSSSAVKEPTPNPTVDSGTSVTPDGGGGTVDGGGGDGGPTDCVQNPTTHEEIINACTTAVRITKNPTLSKLQDGGLPPLP